MAIAVAGMWERGWIAPINEADLWAFPLRDFGVDEWHMTPISGIDRPELVEWRTLEEMLDELRKRFSLVFVFEDAAVELADFVHPTDAAYVFGRVVSGPFPPLNVNEGSGVFVDTEIKSGLLWPHQAAVAILHDRMVKKCP